MDNRDVLSRDRVRKFCMPILKVIKGSTITKTNQSAKSNLGLEKLQSEVTISRMLEGPYQPKLDIGKVLRIFSYVPTPTKLTSLISKTQLLGPKKGGSSGPFLYLARFSGF